VICSLRVVIGVFFLRMNFRGVLDASSLSSPELELSGIFLRAFGTRFDLRDSTPAFSICLDNESSLVSIAFVTLGSLRSRAMLFNASRGCARNQEFFGSSMYHWGIFGSTAIRNRSLNLSDRPSCAQQLSSRCAASGLFAPGALPSNRSLPGRSYITPTRILTCAC
jgi:hypothetical protein